MRTRLIASLVVGLSMLACSSADVTDGVDTLSSGLVDPHSVCPAGYADAPPRSGTNKGYLAAEQLRDFDLILPPASFTGPRPVFFAFHGTSESGASFSDRARLADYAARGFIVVAPDANANGLIWPVWDGMRLESMTDLPNKDLALVDSLLACVGAHFEIDRSRIFAGGHSAGGIFMNHLLRARSNVFAGGIVASGMFDLTSAPANPPLEPMTVIVTWGGDNDGTGSAGVSGLTFVEEAALASQYYAKQPGVAQAYCRGNDLGHVWLPLNDWFIDILLSRPKGTTSPLVLPPLPATARVSCGAEAYRLPPAAPVTCAPAERAGCAEQCQLLADCAVENMTVGTMLASELAGLGVTPGACGDCVARCNSEATAAADVRVLSCLKGKQASTTCTGGIEGSFPLFAAIDSCCEGNSGSNVCKNLCSHLYDSLASMFLPSCEQFR
jgi:predicted esterase